MQRNSPIIICLILLTILMLPGCAAKRMARQAAEYERAGMFKEAAELYFNASQRKPREVEYKTGLRRSGQMHIDQVSTGIVGAYGRGEYRKAVYDYLEMQQFVSRVQTAGVQIQINQMARQSFEGARERYLDQQYTEGQRLIQEQSFDQARAIFTEIQNIQPGFRDTQTYLNTATLEPMYQSGNRHFRDRRYMEAYREWERVARRDPNYKDVQELMQQALQERYRQGTSFLMNENFTAAATALGEVHRINPNYQDVKELYTEARNEPIYRKAQKDLKNGRCRSAYRAFSKVLEDAGQYKSASQYKDQALDCASFPVAIYIPDIQGNSSETEIFEQVLIESILQKEDPFVSVHKLPSVSRQIDRSFRSSTGTLDRNRVRELKTRHSIDAMLVINFSNFQKLDGRQRKTTKSGFLRQVTTNDDGEVTYHDRLVKYDEYEQTNTLRFSINYQLISTENNRILLSRRINVSEEDHMHYADFDGDSRNLYPAMGGDQQRLSIDERNQRQLQNLLRADRSIRSANHMRDEQFRKAALEIAEALVAFNPE